MNIETIELRKIIASEGMVLTNGENYGRVIFLSDDADVSLWYEITEDEYNEIQKSLEDNIYDGFEIIDEDKISADEFLDMVKEVL